jgi:GrpB-like predicted nucleotidyltransferase (UPF0157 family)/SAM-dependent methyltransferase
MTKTILGQHKRDISMVPYQPGWVEIYDRESGILKEALGDKAMRIEHIGNTSISGMIAKPVVDIMLAVSSLPQAVELVPLLESLGYLYRAHDTVPERLFFAKESSPEVRTHHLNLTELCSGFWINQLTFRDYLRTHDHIAVEYGELKQDIAARYAQPKVLNPESKTPFVTRVLALAEKGGYLTQEENKMIGMKIGPHKHIPYFRRSPLGKAYLHLLDLFDWFMDPNSMLPPRSMMIVRRDIFKKVGVEFKERFINYAGLQPDHKMLDVGCGLGRMAIPLTSYLTSGGEYYGFDLREITIEWCQQKIASNFSNFHFLHSNVISKHYYNKGETSAAEYKFPFEDNFFDLVIVVSVFTHMLPEDVDAYLGEISRVLKPGGKCLVTFYLLGDDLHNPASKIRGPLNFQFECENYHTTNLKDPESGVAFNEARVKQWFEGYGFWIDHHFLPGTWSDRGDYLSSQDLIILSKV